MFLLFFKKNVFSLRSKCAAARNVLLRRMCMLCVSAKGCTSEQSDHIAQSAPHYAKRITLKIFVILQKFLKMAFLTEDLVFGPIHSRRLGNSLGVNLLPKVGKICTFNCVYCECGWNPEKRDEKARLATPQEYEQTLANALKSLVGTPKEPDSITFSGNGEPTLHPSFPEIIDITIKLRDKYVPKAVISVLTNGTNIHKDEIFKALQKVDNNICKLDGGTLDTIKKINLPNVNIDLERYIDNLQRFEGQVIIQTLFLRGEHNGLTIDNTTDEEVNLWLSHLKKINPRKTMIYVIDRETPEKNLEKLSSEEMSQIADKVKALGLNVESYS